MLRIAWRAGQAARAAITAAPAARLSIARLLQSGSASGVPSAPETVMPASFSQLGIDERIVSALGRLGVVAPTPAQAKTIPRLLAGQNVALRADTGTGKSLGLVVVATQRLLPLAASPPPAGTAGAIKTLIVVPTRELAWQLHGWTAHMLADAGMDERATDADIAALMQRLKPLVQVAYRGSPDELIDQDRDLASQPPHTLIGTSTRLLELVHAKRVDLSQLSLLIVDEGDSVLKPNSRYATLRARKTRLEHPPAGAAFLQAIRPHVPSDCLVAVSSATLNSPTRSELKRTGWLPPGGATKHISLTSAIGAADAPVRHVCVYANGDDAKLTALADLVRELEPTSAIIFRNDMAGLQSTAKKLRQHGLTARLVDELLRARITRGDSARTNTDEITADSARATVDGENVSTNTDETTADSARATVDGENVRTHTDEITADSAASSVESSVERVIGRTDTRGVDLKARLLTAFRQPARADAFPGPGLWLSSESTIRGIDTNALSHIFVMDRLDGAHASYIHLAGRLARRAGQSGTAVIIADEATRPTVERLKRDVGIAFEERWAAGERPRAPHSDDDDDDDDERNDQGKHAKLQTAAAVRSNRSASARRAGGERRRSAADGSNERPRRFSEGRFAEGRFAESRFAESRSSEGRFSEGRFAESRQQRIEERARRFEERSPRFSEERAPRFSEERTPRFSEERAPRRFSDERSQRFSEERRTSPRRADGERRRSAVTADASEGRERRFDENRERRFGEKGERRFEGNRERRFDENRERRFEGNRERRFEGNRERRFEGNRERRFDERPPRFSARGGSPPSEERRDWKAPSLRRPQFGRRHHERPDY